MSQIDEVLGRAPEQLSLEERRALAGSSIALEVYTPETLPLRRIQAIGDSVEACIAMLRARQLDPAKFEYTRLKAPY